MDLISVHPDKSTGLIIVSMEINEMRARPRCDVKQMMKLDAVGGKRIKVKRVQSLVDGFNRAYLNARTRLALRLIFDVWNDFACLDNHRVSLVGFLSLCVKSCFGVSHHGWAVQRILQIKLIDG